MERIICLVAGYLCGLLQTGYLYGKYNHIDIRDYGSGNSGTTNALRVLGKKAGAVVFFGDFLKCFLPCMAVRLLFRNQPDVQFLLILYTGLGVILGHNYPCYLHFKGGKGIAATAGLMMAVDFKLTMVCLAAFVILVGLTRFVSLGSLIVAVVFFAWMVAFAGEGGFHVGTGYRMEFYIVAFAIAGLAFWRHRANIGRLIRGNENKISFGKK